MIPDPTPISSGHEGGKKIKVSKKKTTHPKLQLQPEPLSIYACIDAFITENDENYVDFKLVSLASRWTFKPQHHVCFHWPKSSPRGQVPGAKQKKKGFVVLTFSFHNWSLSRAGFGTSFRRDTFQTRPMNLMHDDARKGPQNNKKNTCEEALLNWNKLDIPQQWNFWWSGGSTGLIGINTNFEVSSRAPLNAKEVPFYPTHPQTECEWPGRFLGSSEEMIAKFGLRAIPSEAPARTVRVQHPWWARKRMNGVFNRFGPQEFGNVRACTQWNLIRSLARDLYLMDGWLANWFPSWCVPPDLAGWMVLECTGTCLPWCN